MARNLRGGWLLAVIVLQSSIVLAQHGVTFIFPDVGTYTFHYLDTINVTWTSAFEAPFLYTFCNSLTTGDEMQEKSSAVPGNGSLLVTLDFNNGSPCFFDLRPNGTIGNGYGANSLQFTLLFAEASQEVFGLSSTGAPSSIITVGPSSSTTVASTLASTTSSSISTTSTPVSTTSSSISTTSSASITSSLSAGNPPASISTFSATSLPTSISSGSSSGLSSGAKAGIGAGIAVLAVAVAAGVGFWWGRKRRSNKSSGYSEPGQQYPYGAYAPGSELKRASATTAPSSISSPPNWTPMRNMNARVSEGAPQSFPQDPLQNYSRSPPQESLHGHSGSMAQSFAQSVPQSPPRNPPQELSAHTKYELP